MQIRKQITSSSARSPILPLHKVANPSAFATKVKTANYPTSYHAHTRRVVYSLSYPIKRALHSPQYRLRTIDLSRWTVWFDYLLDKLDGRNACTLFPLQIWIQKNHQLTLRFQSPRFRSEPHSTPNYKQKEAKFCLVSHFQERKNQTLIAFSDPLSL